jgi:hypothetical protein
MSIVNHSYFDLTTCSVIPICDKNDYQKYLLLLNPFLFFYTCIICEIWLKSEIRAYIQPLHQAHSLFACSRGLKLYLG